MRKVLFCIFLMGFLCKGWSQDLQLLKVRDEVTTFSTVESYILENGSIYWGEKGVGALFGAFMKLEGENLVILCKDTLCVPFYRDDPQNVVVDRKGKPFLLAQKVAETFGYKRVELDKNTQEIRLFKTPKPLPDKPTILPLLDITLPDSSGKNVSFSKYKGKKLLILVWAPWEKTRDNLTAWNRIFNELGEKIQYLLVAETMEGRDRLEPYLSLLKPRPVCLVDAGFRITLFYQLHDLPSLLLVDEKGNLVCGPLKARFDDPLLREILTSWVKGKPVDELIDKDSSLKAVISSAEIEEAIKRIELAEVLWTSGKKNEAIEEYRRVSDKFPEHAIFKGQLSALTDPDGFYPILTPNPTQDKNPGL